MSPLTSALISIPTLLNIAAVMWLLWWTSKRRGRTSTPQAETTGHVWDEDLARVQQSAAALVAGAVRAHRRFSGSAISRCIRVWATSPARSSWSRGRAVRGAVARRPKRCWPAPLRRTRSSPLATLEQDPAALRIGRNLFLNNCAACHGSDARGAPGFPNLTDRDWLWGGDPDTVLATIRDGRAGMMPALATGARRRRRRECAGLRHESLRTHAAGGNAAAGKQKFAEICSACHGADGRGNPLLGAPNLTDTIWLHGGALATIRDDDRERAAGSDAGASRAPRRSAHEAARRLCAEPGCEAVAPPQVAVAAPPGLRTP